MHDRIVEFRRREAIRHLIGIVSGVSALSVVGCSKMLLGTGKILFGDPKIPAEFTKLTKEDLSRGTKTVLVVCATPEAVEEEVSTLKYDLINGVTRRLKLNGVKTVNPDRVADWLDEHDGIISDTQELAEDFETDYIIWVDVHAFHLHEPNSNKLLRGHTSGYIRVFKVEEINDKRRALKVYQTEFALTYPQHQAISEEGRSLGVFQNDYVNYLCNLLSERFYDHRPGTHY